MGIARRKGEEIGGHSGNEVASASPCGFSIVYVGLRQWLAPPNLDTVFWGRGCQREMES